MTAARFNKGYLTSMLAEFSWPIEAQYYNLKLWYQSIMPPSFYRREDTTIMLTIWETKPHECKIKCIGNKHTQMHKLLSNNRSNFIHSQHFTCSYGFIKQKKLQGCKHRNTYLRRSLSHNQICRCNTPPNHRPVCSSISLVTLPPLRWVWLPQWIREN